MSVQSGVDGVARISDMNMAHIENVDLIQLRLIEALAEHGSVSAAAQAIGLSQSAGSHALAKLRTQFGDPLFVRTSRGMRPTVAGERVGATVRGALRLLRDGFEAGEAFEPDRSGRVFRVYMSDVGQMVFLPGLLAHIKATAPGVSLRALPIPLRAQEAALESGEVDLAIGHFKSFAGGFYRRRLFRETYVCVARSDHPNFEDGMSIEGFREAEHAYADASGMAHDMLEEVLRRHGIARRISLTVPQFMVLPMVIAGSDLLVTMPERLAAEFAKLIRIKVMPLPVRTPGYDINLFWHRRAHNDPANKWLRRSFAKLFAD